MPTWNRSFSHTSFLFSIEVTSSCGKGSLIQFIFICLCHLGHLFIVQHRTRCKLSLKCSDTSYSNYIFEVEVNDF